MKGRLQSEQGFVAAELLREATEMSLGIDPVNISAALMETPVFSGRILAREVQPGLFATADDIVYLADADVAVEVEPSVICGILLRGDPQSMAIDHHGTVAKALERPVLVGFGAKACCRHTSRAKARSCGAGFMLRPKFFERFGDHVSDDGLAALRAFGQVPFRTATLARSPRLVELARRNLEHPYNGQLGELFIESNTLSFVAEVASLLRRETLLIAEIGRRHYDRVLEARDILDRDVGAPPSTLELARRVGVNVTTLQANFKKVLGSTIFGYIRDQRLQMARILLAEHGLAAAEAGRKVGFSSPAAFTTAYRRYFGHPPTADGNRGKQ